MDEELCVWYFSREWVGKIHIFKFVNKIRVPVLKKLDEKETK